MAKFNFVFFLILSFSFTVKSQNYNKYSNQFIRSYGGKYETDMLQLKRFGFNNVFQYKEKEFNENKDSVHILSKIKYVSIKISENLNLKAIVKNLEKLPNLEYVQFKTPASLFDEGKVTNIVFPENIYTLKKVKTISLKGDFYWNYNNFINSISKLPQLENLVLIWNNFPNKIFKNPNFSKLSHIKGLSYSGSNKIIFPESIKDFKNLTSLSLSFSADENSIKDILKFSKLNNLKYLDLNWMTIKSNFLGNFKNLEELSLSSVEIKNSTNIFLDISKIKNLKELKLSNNKLNSLPKEIGLLKNLESFYSSNNKFSKKLPIEFYSLTNLKNIEIQGSDLEVVNNNINKLQNIETLKLYFNQIKTLPKSFINLSKLKRVYLEHNKLKKLPKDLGKLNISYLSLNNNLIEKLPKSIIYLKNLDSLNLEENYILQLPKRIGKLKNLTYLNLELNKLSQLPKSFGKLQNLKYLNISRNEIAELPTNFGNLKALKILDAEFCHLKKLPKSFGKLKKLERLALTNNNLQELSKNFGNLQSLKKLYLYNRSYYNFVYDRNFKKDTTITLKVLKNNITKLPISFSRLPKLEFIELSLNKNLNEKQLFNILKKSKFKNYTINLENCNIKNLPTSGWDSIKVATLNLRGNLISEIPKDLINSKFLKTLNLNKNKKINTYRGNKSELNLLFAEKGYLQESSLQKTDELAMAYAKTANRKIGNKEYEKGVEYAEKSLKINKEIAYKYLYEDDYIEALYYSKRYKKAIDISDIQIKKDTSQNVRFLNSILPNFKYQAKSYLALGDTLKAIKKFAIASKKFNTNNWTEAGMLAKKIKKNTLSEKYFNESYTFYKNYISKNPKASGYHLSLIEAYIIGNNIDLAKKHLNKIEIKKFITKDYYSLIIYFKAIIYALENNLEKYNNQKNTLKKYLKNNKITLNSWSFQLIKDWLELNNLNKEQKNKIIKLNSLF
ncbi:leucine-rich repeat domain-containing protein [Polaribacter cellanae]|uniref:Disease resistance R13L4/SHOC-2-like LRR domain-containing protein n=1 Tax=Polaribacter cellanae TaxID=2818493 RepID=A0A975H9L0_9FLAO|nr:hypothetical protein [Polaribacter cellanae]QTE23025.1 hypothetical protein J3359_01755 [Polaribacter cellanae]